MGWFENPNHFSAWLALVAPWLWGLTRWSCSCARTKSRWVWLAFAASCAAELAVLIALAGTYSRGGWVAWMAGALVWLGFIQAWRQRAESIAMGVRVLFAAAAILCFSAHERLDPAGWAQDRSVGNRLEVWQGAAQMMVDRPWAGWGTGQSGWVYCEAYQPVEREELYRTCVNSYLTLGAEQGLWFFMLLVGVAVAPLGAVVSATRARPDQSDERRRMNGIWQGAAVAAWLAWAVANGFSTVIEVSSLWPWVVPVAAVAFARLPWCRAAGVGVAGGVAAGLVILSVGLLRPPSVRVVSGEGWWRFTATKGASRKATPWLVLPDERVLGPVAGREVRRLALARSALEVWLPQVTAPFIDRLQMDETRSLVREAPSVGGTEWARVWVLGASVPPTGYAVSKMWRLHPLGWPGDDTPLVSGIILPQVAGAGDLLAWRNWAEANEVSVRRSGVAGVAVRARWPQIIGQEAAVVVRP